MPFEPELVPDLRTLIEGEAMEADMLSVALPINADASHGPRSKLHVVCGTKEVTWTVPSIRALFRGDQRPPPENEMNRYPPQYVPFFYAIEKVLLLASSIYGDPYDNECEEAYGAMRRRPDGKSLGPIHDAIWQSAALFLGIRRVSEMEYDAVFSRLARSARRWSHGSGTREYVRYLSRSLG